MSINLICNECHKTHPIKATICTKCKTKLTHAKYKVRVRDSFGKTRSKTLPTLTLARQYELSLKTKAVLRESPTMVNVSPKVTEVFKAYLEWAKLNKKSWKDDEIRWSKHIAPYMPTKVSQITPHNHMLPILSRMATNGYAQATIKQVFVLTKRVLNWAIKNGVMNGLNPIGDMETPRMDDNRVDNVLSSGDIKRLETVLDEWQNEKAVLVVRFALYTGRRKGEILNLKWKDVHPRGDTITLSRTKSGKRQTFPLNKKAIGIIDKARGLKRRSPYVFSSTKDGHYGSTFDETWRRIRTKAGLSVRFHDLRHTFASWLASSGKVDIYVLKELLGHSSIEMTQRYAHLINGATRKAVEVLDDVF